ncbi:MAG: Trk system potassium transporter TrkA [Rhodobacteraceae bacterium]|nr:MAG: Trk system potassium transporter TrkA [Paracoccaceae bacterium]
MKIIVCGAGRVGAQIAKRLSEDGARVTVVDTNANLIRRVTDSYDVAGVAGHASHPDTLARAGAADADMLIAATALDEVNMFACQVAHSLFSVPRKIARVRAQAYMHPRWAGLFGPEAAPIDVAISPETEVAEVALSRLVTTAAFDSCTFLEGEVEFVGLTLDGDCPALNTPLRQLGELFSTLKARIVGLRRNGVLLSPGPDDQLFDGDSVYFVAARADVARSMAILGRENPPAKRVVVIGAGNVGLSLAQRVEADPRGLRAKVIERDRARAEHAADRLGRTVVLNGDALDPAILDEAGVADADAVLALTDDDRANVLSCALARQAGCPLSIALTNDPVFSALAGALGIDVTINPRATTVSTILRHVRRGRIRAVHAVGEGEAEAIEAQVLATSPIAGKRLRDADFPVGATVGAVLGRDGLTMPTGDTVVREGDLLLVFALRDAMRRVEALFRVSIDFF